MANGHDLLPTWENVKEGITWVSAAIASASATFAGWCVKRWRSDTKRLESHEQYIAKLRKAKAIGRMSMLTRKMKEVDRIRKVTEDGMKGLRQVAQHEREIKELKQTQLRFEQQINAMFGIVSKTQNDVEWIKRKLGHQE